MIERVCRTTPGRFSSVTKRPRRSWESRFKVNSFSECGDVRRSWRSLQLTEKQLWVCLFSDTLNNNKLRLEELLRLTSLRYVTQHLMGAADKHDPLSRAFHVSGCGHSRSGTPLDVSEQEHVRHVTESDVVTTQQHSRTPVQHWQRAAVSSLSAGTRNWSDNQFRQTGIRSGRRLAWLSTILQLCIILITD